MAKKRVGFIVNPIAGMGGRVGLKGTDGEAYKLALARGAQPVAPRRAMEFLECVSASDFEFVTAPSRMGYDIIIKSKHADKIAEVVGELEPSRETTREDTIRIARLMKEKADIIVFVGGDGTARDIFEAVGLEKPVIGVPSGVKMYSAVFATNPCAAGRLLEAFIEGEADIVEREVLDIDEESFRRDELRVRLYGYLRTPVRAELVQGSKSVHLDSEEELNKIAIAQFLVENMKPGTPYILGPGSTVKAICQVLGLPCTTLGVDVIVDGKLVARDACEKELLEIINKYGGAVIVVSPIGGQGFLFGRGNQQISPEVIRKVGKEGIIVVATERKARSLRHLLVDTGDPELDKELRGYYKVLVNYGRYVVMKVI